MKERIDITEAMTAAAITAALPLNLNRDDARRILAAGLSKMNTGERTAPYPLYVTDTLSIKKARFIGVTERRCYYRVETEDGKMLTVHGNDIQPSRGP